MATGTSAAFVLPKVPVPHKNFIQYIQKHPQGSIHELVNPYNAFEAKLREGFAQHRGDQALQDPNVNAVPIFGEDIEVLRVEHRRTDDETLNQKYVMPLVAKDRKPGGAPATVESIQDFKKNFNYFSESSLADLDWNNVVAAGSSVVTALLPVPDKYKDSKKAQREYYHQQLAPSSDVDLFIWGLDEDAALKKIEQIERSVRNAILEEVTTVRTKNAITIASHYPVRHVQIVLRLYKSVSEILTGFDVDCSCFAYDGCQVYGTPRGVAAFKTQTNTIDLSRRSPSYESRLSKYAHRGFEVYYLDLDRSRIDPTIFERSFVRTMGLARLLVLEQLPKPSDREEYLDQRREERGRPSVTSHWNRGNALPGNVKDKDPDDIAEWIYDDEVSNYHSFTVPYGPKYHAKKIEKLLYTKDLLLNAEWNRNKARTVNLHRHPCFVGPVEAVMHDCCGFCPDPATDEERVVAEEERKIYISGDITFMKDDPGRQTIGSFNPLNDDDWTDMAYVGNTQELCQKICDGDIDFVDNWCARNPKLIDRRDHTGRTPLHIAAQCSTPDILKCLVIHGARIVARLVDGLTALHIAAARGEAQMVTTLLEKSEENEARESEKEEQRNITNHGKTSPELKQTDEEEVSQDEGSDVDMDHASSDDETSTTEGSFVKVRDEKPADEDALDNTGESEPDVYDVDVLAWDAPVSALHIAIIGGHIDVIKVLVSNFGAEVLLPIKIVDSYSQNPKHAIMTLVLAAQISGSASSDVAKELLSLGASSAQADLKQVSAFHYLVAKRRVELLKACLELDRAAASTVLGHLILEDAHWRPKVESPLTTAIRSGDEALVGAVLDFGAKPFTDLDDFAAAYSHALGNAPSYWRKDDDTDISKIWKEEVAQPVLLAVEHEMPAVIMDMVEAGADIDTIDREAHQSISRLSEGEKFTLQGGSLLDAVTMKISSIESAINFHFQLPEPRELMDDQTYLEATTPGSYERWFLSKTVEMANNVLKQWRNDRNERLTKEEERPGKQQRVDALRALQKGFVGLKEKLLQRGAHTLEGLHPELFNRKRKRDREAESESSEEAEAEIKEEKMFHPKLAFKPSTANKSYEGYLQLFEAAWAGNLSRIKQLTLANWGPEARNAPLMVTVQDSKGFTPFAIAMYRRHFEVATLILEVAKAQYKDSDGDSPKRRYTIADDDSDCYSEGDEDEVEISSQIVDETFTIDNIASLRQSVGSQVSASGMLMESAETWCLMDLPEEEARLKLGSKVPSVTKNLEDGRKVFKHSLRDRSHTTTHLGRYALVCHDIDLLRFWLRSCQEALTKKSDVGYRQFTGFDTSDFEFALEHGLIEELSEMIKISGAELPLEILVKQSGVQEEEKPKYYQGLSIGGKKMTKWARERGGSGHDTLNESTPPLLQAAYQGGLAAVEWFLSDTPSRLYKEYAANNAADSRLKTLIKAHGGLDQVFSTWLKQRSHLSLHAAIMSGVPKPASLSVLKYLLSAFPAAIDNPAGSASLTPLALAFLTGRTDTASVLIGAGADQTTRSSNAKNLIHLVLIYLSSKSRSPEELILEFRSLLSLLDTRLLSSLWTERCRDNPGALTPLAFWLASIDTDFFSYSSRSGAKLVPEVLTVMLDFDGGEALTMIDGSGQFPLHQAVKQSYTGVVKLMLEHDPTLLARENAMGQTPLELAESLYVRDCAKGNPNIRASEFRKLEDRKCEDFAEHETRDIERGKKDENVVMETWRICKEFAMKKPTARILVSVSQAREVAKRLAERNKAKSKEENAEEGTDQERKDEVDDWLGFGALEMG